MLLSPKVKAIPTVNVTSRLMSKTIFVANFLVPKKPSGFDHLCRNVDSSLQL